MLAAASCSGATPAHGSVSRVTPPTDNAVTESWVESSDFFPQAETKRGAERNTVAVDRGVGGLSTCSSFRLGGAREMQRARLRTRVSCSERVLARDPKGRMRINGALGGATRRSKRGSGVGGQEVSKSTA